MLGRRLTILMVLLAGAAALVAAPATASTADDQQIADDAVLSAAEVPPGFTAVQADQGDAEAPPECTTIERAQQAVEKVPHAASAFALDEAGDGYALLQSTAAVFAKEGRAESVYDLYRGVKAKRCIAALLEATFTQPGVTVDVQIGTFRPELDDKGSKKVIKGGDAYVGYAGGVRADAGGEPLFYEFAAVVTRAGRGIGRVLVVNSGTVPTEDLQRFTQKIVETLDQAK